MTDQPETQPYRVLARKYRPGTFAEVIGQDAMVRTLTNAIAAERLPHAFILTGVRGVGKTSTARIIARALNCIGTDGTGGPTAEPCGECEHCTAIAEDRHVDVLEMDAASRTGVDDIRELIDGVRYRPGSARYKVYIVDEVHMLSKNAFNALLKTLEEPPEHVKFVFATTEIRKVPVTVLSRCQRFDLRRVDIETLAAHFAAIAEKESAAVTAEALNLIARAADGSVRDGLSLLDQAIAHCGEQVSAEQVRDMLGLADGGQLYDLFDALMKGDIGAALELMARMHASGADAVVILQDLLELTHWLTRVKLAPAVAEGAGVSEIERTRGKEMAEALGLPVLGRTWQMLLKGIDEARGAPSAIQAVEMVLVRIAYAAELPVPADVIKSLQAGDQPRAARPAQPAANDGTIDGAGKAEAPGLFAAAPKAAPTPASSTTPVASAASGASQALAEAPGPEPEPAAAPDAVAAGPQSFEEVVALFAEKREELLRAALVNQVHLVGFEPGHIEFRPTADAPPDLALKVSRRLGEWTGVSWLVSLSTEEGEATLREQRDEAARARHGAALEHPLVKAALDAFPGATVTAVRDRDPSELPDAAPDDDADDANGETLPVGGDETP